MDPSRKRKFCSRGSRGGTITFVEGDCPYCGAPLTMILDLTVAAQSYVEDCDVCCNPIGLRFRVEDGEVVRFDAKQVP